VDERHRRRQDQRPDHDARAGMATALRRSSASPWKRRWRWAIAARSSGRPSIGGYWLQPSSAASAALARVPRAWVVREALAEIDRLALARQTRHRLENAGTKFGKNRIHRGPSYAVRRFILASASPSGKARVALRRGA
jgi:hypothetical protein